MGQKKLIRFAEIKTFPNVLEYPKSMPGKWHQHFGNNNPIILELACGKGEYTIGLASLYPDKNFIGIDIKGNRLWVGAKQAAEQNINNAAFLRIQIDNLEEYFSEGEISEIWITFPDPHLRTSRANRRLTHPKFLRIYKHVIKTDGKINLKSDSPDLYHFTKTVLEMYGLKTVTDLQDVHGSGPITEELKIQTHYESLDIAESKKIFYLCFTLPAEIANKDDALHELIKETEWKRYVEEVFFPGSEPEDFYYENGNLVMSKQYHLKRGYCCGNGCLNCPYNYDKVPEPRRSQLLSLNTYGKK